MRTSQCCDARLQRFVDACFERAGSTQQALRLLRQFCTVLHRESSRAHLDAKYAAIFARFTVDLEGVRHKLLRVNRNRMCRQLIVSAASDVGPAWDFRTLCRYSLR